MTAEYASYLDYPEYMGLHRDVLERPADDSPRLILADWLDDHGKEQARERAEFIRLEILLEHCHPSEKKTLRERRQELRKILNRNLWLRGWPGVPLKQYYAVSWKRGFTHGINLGLKDFLDVAGKLFSLEPVTRVTLKGTGPMYIHGSHGFCQVGVMLLDYRNSQLPPPIYSLLEGYRLRQGYGSTWMVYDFHVEAEQALHKALLLYARKEAGLPTA